MKKWFVMHHKNLSESSNPEHIKNQFKTVFKNIEKITEMDKIKLQFNDFHSNMPPLNEKGFNKLTHSKRCNSKRR